MHKLAELMLKQIRKALQLMTLKKYLLVLLFMILQEVKEKVF